MELPRRGWKGRHGCCRATRPRGRTGRQLELLGNHSFNACRKLDILEPKPCSFLSLRQENPASRSPTALESSTAGWGTSCTHSSSPANL